MEWSPSYGGGGADAPARFARWRFTVTTRDREHETERMFLCAVYKKPEKKLTKKIRFSVLYKLGCILSSYLPLSQALSP